MDKARRQTLDGLKARLAALEGESPHPASGDFPLPAPLVQLDEIPGKKDTLSSGDAFRSIVRLCGYHDFCAMGMRKRLAREGFADDSITQAVGEAVRIGLIDDLRWGEMRVAALMRKGVGETRIVRELEDCGIDVKRLDGWPDDFQERFGDEYERAFEFLCKNPPRAKDLRAAAYGKLVRKGYAPAVAHRISGKWYEGYRKD